MQSAGVEVTRGFGAGGDGADDNFSALHVPYVNIDDVESLGVSLSPKRLLNGGGQYKNNNDNDPYKYTQSDSEVQLVLDSSHGPTAPPPVSPTNTGERRTAGRTRAFGAGLRRSLLSSTGDPDEDNI